MPEELRQVGEFPNHSLNRRRLIRATKNPMDKCTIVSIYPKEITEIKHTIEPGKFTIPMGTVENPSLLVVGPSSWWREIDQDQPMLEIPVSSIQIADSFIKDSCNSMIGAEPGIAVPGVFFVLGEENIIGIKSKYKAKLQEVKDRQDNWFRLLVRLADAFWARANGNPLAIADEMRLGARMLGLEDKPWLKDFTLADMQKCKACGGLRDPQYPVCPSCKAIDPEHPLAKELKFAV